MVERERIKKSKRIKDEGKDEDEEEETLQEVQCLFLSPSLLPSSLPLLSL